MNNVLVIKKFSFLLFTFLLASTSLPIFSIDSIAKPKLQEDVNYYINYGNCYYMKNSPNEKMLATTSTAGLLIWDLESKKLIKNIVDSVEIDFIEWIDDQKICMANCKGSYNKIDISNHIIDRGVYLYKVIVNGSVIGTGKIIK